MTEPSFVPVGAAVVPPKQVTTSVRRWLGAAIVGVLVSFAALEAWMIAIPQLGDARALVGLVLGSVATGHVARVSSVRGWLVAFVLTCAVDILLGFVLVFLFLAAAGG